MRKTPVSLLHMGGVGGSSDTLPVGQVVYGVSRRAVEVAVDSGEERLGPLFGSSPDHPGMEKKAQVAPDMMGSSESRVAFFPPLWFSPLMTWVHFYMPRDIKTTYTWIRHYDTFQPLIGNAIDLHTQIPLSRFTLKGITDPYIRRVYETEMEMLGGLLLFYDLLREYWLLGEVFAYLYWDESVGMFTDIQILPPDDIIVEGTYWGKKFYINPDTFRMIPEARIDRDVGTYDPELVRKIKQGEKIELDPFFLLTFQRKQSPYMNRGQSIVLRVLKHLIYYDKLLEAQYAIAQRHITPKEIWKIGNDQYPATPDQIAELRRLVQQAGLSPLFSLFTNHTVQVDYVGAVGKFPNFQAEYEQIEKFILTGMFTNKAITHGEGPTYANASVAMRAMMSRYMQVRGLLETVVLNYIFLPTAVAHDFYEITEAELSHNVRRPFSERRPVLPEFDWKAKANLLDTPNMVTVARALKEIGFSHHTAAEILGVDYEEDKYWKEKEIGSVFDPVYEEWRRRMGQGVPAPVGPEKTSTFKLPIKVAEYRVSKDTVEPKVEEKEFSWVTRGHLLNRVLGWRILVKPYLEKKQPVPAKYLGSLKPAEKKGFPTLVELESITLNGVGGENQNGEEHNV